jgi:SAM-dependent methyltransferase
MKRFDYSDYEAQCRSGGYHTARRYLSMLVPIFEGCNRVLDMGCGQGIFLQLLQAKGISAVGVDSNQQLLAIARRSGAEVVQADVIQYLNAATGEFDGMFCSHLIEHLCFDQVVDLLEGACTRLASRGVLVLLFPNPASLNMQLNYFWRDPTHVRLYQRDLIVALLTHYGLAIETGFPEAISWASTSLAGGNPRLGLWRRLARQLRATLRRQLEIDTGLLNQPEDVLIVARK